MKYLISLIYAALTFVVFFLSLVLHIVQQHKFSPFGRFECYFRLCTCHAEKQKMLRACKSLSRWSVWSWTQGKILPIMQTKLSIKYRNCILTSHFLSRYVFWFSPLMSTFIWHYVFHRLLSQVLPRKGYICYFVSSCPIVPHLCLKSILF